ncbi:hypothetical protein Tco_1326808 [Tanacetum coccineum]
MVTNGDKVEQLVDDDVDEEGLDLKSGTSDDGTPWSKDKEIATATMVMELIGKKSNGQMSVAESFTKRFCTTCNVSGSVVKQETTPFEMLEYQVRVVMKYKAAKEAIEQVRVSLTKSKTEMDHPLSPLRIHKELLMAVTNGDSKDNASTFDS